MGNVGRNAIALSPKPPPPPPPPPMALRNTRRFIPERIFLPAAFHGFNGANPNNRQPGAFRRDAVGFISFGITIIIFTVITLALLKLAIISGHMTKENVDAAINDIKLHLSASPCGGNNGFIYDDYVNSFNNLIDSARDFMYNMSLGETNVLMEKFNIVINKELAQYTEIRNYIETNGLFVALGEAVEFSFFNILQPVMYKIIKVAIQFTIGMLALTTIVVPFLLITVQIWQFLDKYYDWIILIATYILVFLVSGLVTALVVTSWTGYCPDCELDNLFGTCAALKHIAAVVKSCPLPEPNWNDYREEHVKQILLKGVPPLAAMSPLLLPSSSKPGLYNAILESQPSCIPNKD